MSFPSEGSSDDGKRSSKGIKKRKAKKDKKSSKKKKRDNKHSGHGEDEDCFQLVGIARPLLCCCLDPYVQEDVDRLLMSLLQLSPQMETELLDVFKQLDSWGVVYLNDLGDIRLRKKLRHLFRALFVGEVEGEKGKGWRKMLTCKMSLCKFVRRRCKELRPRIEELDIPAEVGPSEALEGGEEKAVDEFTFDAEEAARKAEEAVQRWRAEHAELEGLSADSTSQGVSEQQTAPSEAKPGREEWMLVAPAYLRCLAPNGGADARRMLSAVDGPLELDTPPHTSALVAVLGLGAEILQQKKKDDEEAVRVRAIMEEWNKARKVKSLRELKEEGEFAEGEEAYKRWKRSMEAARNVWGKRAAEQAAEQDFQDDTKKGQPWQRFDRERDLQTSRQVSREDYNKLIQQTKLSGRFKSSWQTSFL
ncbi:hypothetical protein, conserved [Eimeria brunetti]|uniref:Uncharacterized protein n=1 Tax=Eimeria brunetti TaxID=51314 RepID=U6LFR0_9EIME|nr:hypothetical protein, conserved [Eimeria brunetti]